MTAVKAKTSQIDLSPYQQKSRLRLPTLKVADDKLTAKKQNSSNLLKSIRRASADKSLSEPVSSTVHHFDPIDFNANSSSPHPKILGDTEETKSHRDTSESKIDDLNKHFMSENENGSKFRHIKIKPNLDSFKNSDHNMKASNDSTIKLQNIDGSFKLNQTKVNLQSSRSKSKEIESSPLVNSVSKKNMNNSSLKQKGFFKDGAEHPSNSPYLANIDELHQKPKHTTSNGFGSFGSSFVNGSNLSHIPTVGEDTKINSDNIEKTEESMELFDSKLKSPTKTPVKIHKSVVVVKSFSAQHKLPQKNNKSI
jgi:hypothetical protein